jgi:hypothetical protein
VLATGVTRPSFACPAGFERVGASPLTIPAETQRRLTFAVGLAGPGRLTIQDLQFCNIEAVEGLYSGRQVIRAGRRHVLDDSERNFTLIRPDRLWTPAGLRYLVTGFIPLRQWLLPAVAWTLLIGGLFLGFFGLNLLLRKQWVEHERFSFPLTILPKELFNETRDERGAPRFTLFRNRIFWIGFAVAFPLAVLKGLHFYQPAIPAPVINTLELKQLVTSPLAKAYLQDVNIGDIWISVFAIILLIDTDVLFSLWAFFFLFQLWNLFGPAFNFNRFPGYPWRHQQGMGAFIAFAILALIVGRRHLGEVMRRAFRFGDRAVDPLTREETHTYRWALLMLLTSLAILAGWGLWTRMGMTASLLFFGYMLVVGFAASKLRAECSAPFSYITPYFGMQFVAAVGGFAVFGATGMLVATIASGFMTTASFLLMAPAQVEMLELGRHFGLRWREIGGGLGLGLLGAIFIGGFVLLCWAYGMGADNFDTHWPYQQNWYYTEYRAGELNADRAFEAGTLRTNPETQPLNIARNLHAKGLGIGVAITLALAVLRSTCMWFPLHPVSYLLASSYFLQGFWLPILLAWVLRTILFRLGGAQTIRKGLVPFCIGMFLACVATVVLFDIVGIYLRWHGFVDIYSKIP